MTSRPLSEVLRDILDNLQDIIRSEAKLAKAELREELLKVSATLSWLVVAAITGFFAIAYFLLSGFLALRDIIPPWAAAVTIALILVALCGLCFVVGLKHRAPAAIPSPAPAIQKENDLG